MTAFGRNPSLFRAIEQRLLTVQSSIPDDITLIAISKKQSADAIRAAYELGLRHFGESRVQEAISKQTQLADLEDITWHFIGHLQGNKAAKALQNFQWIHSIHSLKLAQRLNQLLAKEEEPMPFSVSPQMCLQVKIVPDPNKAGWAVDQLLNDLDALSQLSYLKIVGLMTIPPFGQSEADTLSVFDQTRELADQIRRQALPNIRMEHLSMGMSGDYSLAIQAGATMVRLGRTLFGDRMP